MSGPHELFFDVTAALPPEATAGAQALMAGWAFLPDDLSGLGERPVAITLLSGGSYDRRYHHAVVPGREGYSAAEHLAGLGSIVLLLDHLGMGQSSRLPDQKAATRHVVAAAADAAVRQFLAGMRGGTLIPGAPAMPGLVSVGGGHSMGGMQTVLQQANHGTHAGIMMIGYSAEGVHFYLDKKQVRAADYLPKTEGPDYSQNDRGSMRYNFHWDDVPADVMAYDDTLSVLTPANIGLDSIRTRVVAEEASRIDVPVYICLGERDVSPDPHAEPGYFRSSPDITLHILPTSAHCQSFASTRHQMWDRMHHWAQEVARGL